MKKITEQTSLYRDLEKMSTSEILENINREDQKIAMSVYKEIPSIELLVDAIYNKMSAGGRLFYLGAGTSGRLGILDASECPPTFGVPHGWVIGLIAGGDTAIRKSVEFAEDDTGLAWKDLQRYNICEDDFVVGIAASGTTPYVLHGLANCQTNGIKTGGITCNPGSPILEKSDYPVVVIVGPEFVTGSTRMKSGTAQKLVLNMITTSVMIKLGRIEDNKMVDMQLSNNKLWDRGIGMIRENKNMSSDKARRLLEKYGSVRAVMESIKNKKVKDLRKS